MSDFEDYDELWDGHRRLLGLIVDAIDDLLAEGKSAAVPIYELIKAKIGSDPGWERVLLSIGMLHGGRTIAWADPKQETGGEHVNRFWKVVRPEFHKGDLIWAKHDGREVEAAIIMASPNSKSLFIEMEAIFDGHVGQMPLVLEADGVYRSILSGAEVYLRKRGPLGGPPNA